MLTKLIMRYFPPKTTKAFQLAQTYNQYNDFLGPTKGDVKDYEMKGVCNGIVLEDARDHLINKGETNFINKAKAKVIEKSANFVERIFEYQNRYQIKDSRDKICTKSMELARLLNSEFSESKVLLVGLVTNDPKNGHAISVKVWHTEYGEVYRIFDPNYGESIKYHSKIELGKAFHELRLRYLKECGLDKFSVYDLGAILNEIGIVPEDGSYCKKNKYPYKLIEAIKNSDTKVLFGDLASEVKLDYLSVMFNTDDESICKPTDFYKPRNLMDLAIFKLSEPDLIKLITTNQQLDLTKSLFPIVICLVFANKFTTAIHEALVAKLPTDDQELRQILEAIKLEIENPTECDISKCNQEDPSFIAAEAAIPINKLILEKFVEQENGLAGSDVYWLTYNTEENIVELHANWERQVSDVPV